jgi:hypothetical protein
VRPLAIALVGAVALLAGCESARDREAASLATAVERFRQADNLERPQRVEPVKAVACTAPEVCAAKAACLKGIEPTVKALALKAEVERGLADLKSGTLAPDSPEAAAMPKKLDEAEALLKEGKAAMDRCDQALGDLRLRR